MKRATILQIGPEPAPLWSFADWRDPIPYSSIDWLPWNFQIKRQQSGQISQTQATINIYDSNNELVSYVKSNGLTGVEASIFYVKFANGAWIEDETHNQMILPISECYGQFPWLTIEIDAQYGWNRSPGLPMGDVNCRHILKGLRCQYTGTDTTCARTREHCRLVKNNLRHFGGYHWAPQPGTQIDMGVPYTVPDSPIGGRSYPPRLGGDSGTSDEASDESGRNRTLTDRGSIIGIPR